LRYTVYVRYACGMGQKTSVYLSDDVAAKAKASGVTLGELVRRGLEAGEPESLEAMLRRVVREELAAVLAQQRV
jgi:hypothetical protein